MKTWISKHPGWTWTVAVVIVSVLSCSLCATLGTVIATQGQEWAKAAAVAQIEAKATEEGPEATPTPTAIARGGEEPTPQPTRALEVPVLLGATEPITGGIPGPQDDAASVVQKLWTYPSNNEGRMYFFEVQSGGSVVQLNDMWWQDWVTNSAGVKVLVSTPSVFVIEPGTPEPGGTSAYAVGLGSAWAYHLERDPAYDLMADVQRHGTERLDQGFSGCIFDNRGIKPELVANVGTSTEAQCQELWSRYVAARTQGGSPMATALAPTGQPEPEAVVAAPAQPACGAPTHGKDFASGVVGPFDEVVVATPWGGSLEKQIAVVLDVGQSRNFGQEGGATWIYKGCTPAQAAADALANSGLAVYTLDGDGEMLAWK